MPSPPYYSSGCATLQAVHGTRVLAFLGSLFLFCEEKAEVHVEALWGQPTRPCYLNEIPVCLAARAAVPLRLKLLLKNKTKQKLTIKRSGTIQSTELFRIPSARDGELCVPASCTLTVPAWGQAGHSNPAVRMLIVWGFFLPKGQNCLKNRASDYSLKPFLPRKKIKPFSVV